MELRKKFEHHMILLPKICLEGESHFLQCKSYIKYALNYFSTNCVLATNAPQFMIYKQLGSTFTIRIAGVTDG